MGPRPGETLVGAAPIHQRVKRKRQPKHIQQHIQHTIQRDQCIQRTDKRHHQPRFQEELTILTAVLREVFFLNGTAALIPPDAGISHHRIAVKNQHQAAGKLKTKKHSTPLCSNTPAAQVSVSGFMKGRKSRVAK